MTAPAPLPVVVPAGYSLAHLGVDRLGEAVELVASVCADEWADHPEHCRRSADPERWERLFRERAVVGALRDDGALAAVATVEIQGGDTAYLGTLFVADRRRGLGRALVAWRLDVARQMGASRAIACVSEWNTASLANLAAFGFTVIQSDVDGWDPTAGAMLTLELSLRVLTV